LSSAFFFGANFNSGKILMLSWTLIEISFLMF